MFSRPNANKKITVDTRTTSNTCLRSKLNLHSGTIFNFTQYNIHFIWVVRVCILRRHISCYTPLCYKHSSTAEFRSLHLNNDIARVRYACRPAFAFEHTARRFWQHSHVAQICFTNKLRGKLGIRPPPSSSSHTHTHVRVGVTAYAYSLEMPSKRHHPCVSTICGRVGFGSLQVGFGMHTQHRDVEHTKMPAL